jgi:uncharacterized protein YbjT (DUF2867 family)
MRILVTNPTGRIGRRVLPELLAPEFSVCALLRDPSRQPEEIRDQIDIVRGSAQDAVALRQALDGVEALFWCVPTESMKESDIERHYERFACSAWDAIRRARTPRVVTISALGNETARNAGPFSGLHAMEAILNESGVAIRHLRCGFFMENLVPQVPSICEHGLFSFPMPGNIPIPVTAVKDIADAALRALVRRDWTGIETVSVHGPENLSWNQAAAIIERTLERPLQYVEATAEDYFERLIENGASPEYARSMVEMFSELAEGIMDVEPSASESKLATTLAAWAESQLFPAIEAFSPQLQLS